MSYFHIYKLIMQVIEWSFKSYFYNNNKWDYLYKIYIIQKSVKTIHSFKNLVLLKIIYWTVHFTNIEIVLALRDFIETRNFSNTVASRQSNQLIRTLDYNIDNTEKFCMTWIFLLIIIFTEPKHFICEFSLRGEWRNEILANI